MSFQTVSQFIDLSSDYHHYIFNNDKIWVFSRTYVAQPTYNWGHRVAYTGGYSAYFDTKANEWNPKGKVDFKEQSKEENLEEFLFTFKNQIFMLLYSHFGGIQFLSLLKFNEETRDFERFAAIESDQKSQRVSQSAPSYKHHALLVDGEAPDSRYLITSVDQVIQVHRLKIADDKAHVEYVGEINSKAVQGPPMTPSHAVFIDGAIYMLGAVQGCGMMWQPSRIIKLDLASGAVTNLGAEGDHPGFGFMGSRYTALNSKTKTWFHITGSTRQGMTGSTFSGEVWSLVDLNSESPKWKKSVLTAENPETDDPMIVTDLEGENLFVGSKHLGVVKAKLE